MAKIKLEITGENKASGAVKGLVSDITKAVFTAELLKKGFEEVVKIAKDNVQGFDKMEKSMTNLRNGGLGKIVNVLGKDLVSSLTKGADAVNSFLSKSDNIGKVAGTFGIFKDILNDAVKNGFNLLKDAIKQIMDSLKGVLESSDETTDGFTVLSYALKITGITITVIIKSISTLIQALIELSMALVESGKLIGAFFSALADPSKWGEVKKQFDKTGDSFSKFGKNLFDNTKSLSALSLSLCPLMQ